MSLEVADTGLNCMALQCNRAVLNIHVSVDFPELLTS